MWLIFAHTYTHTQSPERFYSHWSIVTHKDAIWRGSVCADQLSLKGQRLDGCRVWPLTSEKPCWCFSDVECKCYLVQTLWPLRTFGLHHLSPPTFSKKRPPWESLQCVRFNTARRLPCFWRWLFLRCTLPNPSPQDVVKIPSFQKNDLNGRRSKPLRRGPIFPWKDLIFLVQQAEHFSGNCMDKSLRTA